MCVEGIADALITPYKAHCTATIGFEQLEGLSRSCARVRVALDAEGGYLLTADAAATS